MSDAITVNTNGLQLDTDKLETIKIKSSQKKQKDFEGTKISTKFVSDQKLNAATAAKKKNNFDSDLSLTTSEDLYSTQNIPDYSHSSNFRPVEQNPVVALRQPRPTPTNKNVKRLQPKWISNKRICAKFNTLTLNKNKLNNVLQKLALNNQIKNYHETQHGFKVKLHENSMVDVNLKTHEISSPHFQDQHIPGFVNLAKELGMSELDIGGMDPGLQAQCHLEGKQQGIEMKGTTPELEDMLAKQIQEAVSGYLD